MIKENLCQSREKLSANQAFGLITQFAYNLMRFMALAENSL
jgi:hypothetical protein